MSWSMRFVLFPFSPDWTEQVKERGEYLTEIIPGRTGAEQRYRLRARPRRSLEFNLLNIGQPETQLIQSIFWKSQAKPFAVPWWPDGVEYHGTLSAGATTIAVDTTNRLFSLSPLVVIWSDPFNCEVQSVSAVTAGSITCSPLAKSYTNPVVLPAFAGRLPKDGSSLTIDSNELSHGSVRFDCEVQVGDPRPNPQPAANSYGIGSKRYEVLEEEPDWSNAPEQSFARNVSIFDNETAPPIVTERGEVSFQGQGFSWFLDDRTKINAFRDFFDRRKGRLVPFWAPTWREDLTLAQVAPSGSTGIVVNFCDYTLGMFPDLARRYLAIRHPSGSGWIYRKVTSSAIVGNTESLTIDSALPVTLPAGTAVSFLVLFRLASDRAEIAWTHSTFAQAKSTFVEIPKEVG